MLAVPLQKPRKAWPLAAGLTALCLLLFASGAVKPPRQTSDHSAAEENAAAQKAVGNAFFSFVDTITKTQQAQDAYISSMDSKYQGQRRRRRPEGRRYAGRGWARRQRHRGGRCGVHAPAGRHAEQHDRRSEQLRHRRPQEQGGGRRDDGGRERRVEDGLRNALEYVVAQRPGQGDTQTHATRTVTEPALPIPLLLGLIPRLHPSFAQAGKALGAAAYANVDQAGHGVQQALGFAPPDEKAAVRRQWLLEGDLPQPGQLSPTDGPSKSVGCYDANHVWTEPCQRAGRPTHAELLAAQGYGRPSTQGHRLAMANGPGRL